ncbi:unnamed protein product [Heligmosomoides polygyrus]|uniref:Helitron_like_N domain-containing protein n=1 Tax=Heligmosomoides polygyrus TaxID=6339 RepID=A0A183GJE4_HELPZ|nr:unnamed protein product [Heligmosomoides polygyrus]
MEGDVAVRRGRGPGRPRIHDVVVRSRRGRGRPRLHNSGDGSGRRPRVSTEEDVATRNGRGRGGPRVRNVGERRSHHRPRVATEEDAVVMRGRGRGRPRVHNVGDGPSHQRPRVPTEEDAVVTTGRCRGRPRLNANSSDANRTRRKGETSLHPAKQHAGERANTAEFNRLLEILESASQSLEENDDRELYEPDSSESQERRRQVRPRVIADGQEHQGREIAHIDRHRSSTTGIARSETIPRPYHLGNLEHTCEHCGVLHFLSEVKRDHPSIFKECCDLGRILFNFFDDFPEELRLLYVGDPTVLGERYRNQQSFLQNIRVFNSALTMASIGAQIDTVGGSGPYCYRIHGQIYHRIGPLYPSQENQRQYGQIYILDTEAAVQKKLSDVRNADCSPHIMRFLNDLLSRVNVYAQSFKTMSEVEQAEIALAEQENRAPANSYGF